MTQFAVNALLSRSWTCTSYYPMRRCSCYTLVASWCSQIHSTLVLTSPTTSAVTAVWIFSTYKEIPSPSSHTGRLDQRFAHYRCAPSVKSGATEHMLGPERAGTGAPLRDGGVIWVRVALAPGVETPPITFDVIWARCPKPSRDTSSRTLPAWA